jgi:hypothetical protein
VLNRRLWKALRSWFILARLKAYNLSYKHSTKSLRVRHWDNLSSILNRLIQTVSYLIGNVAALIATNISLKASSICSNFLEGYWKQAIWLCSAILVSKLSLINGIPIFWAKILLYKLGVHQCQSYSILNLQY